MTTKRIIFLFKQLLDATAVGSILVLRRAVVFAILLDLILPQLLVGQGSPLSSESKWIAKILNASWRDSVIIRKPKSRPKE
jgi:hypothetical protein